MILEVAPLKVRQTLEAHEVVEGIGTAERS
jgi:hypothetical protein